MLLICTEKEKLEIIRRCDCECEGCVLGHNYKCPVGDWNIITTDEISSGDVTMPKHAWKLER